MNEPIVDDMEYDEICRELKEKWDNVNHYHKHLIDKQSLGAGTGYQLQYNKRIECASIALLNKSKEHENANKKSSR
jgi:NAD-dependent DNA ligase